MFLGWKAQARHGLLWSMIMREHSMPQGFSAAIGALWSAPEFMGRCPTRERRKSAKSFGAKGFSALAKTSTHTVTHIRFDGYELSGPASGAVSAHKYKSLDGVREPDSAHPVTVAVADGACRRPMLATREGGGAVVCNCSARHSALFDGGAR